METIGIIGAGAWGTALAIALRRAGRAVTLYAHEPEVVEAVNTRHENVPFLPGVTLDSAIRATGDLDHACNGDAVLLVAPSLYMRAVCRQARPHWNAGVPAVICTKGIEQESCLLMSEVIGETLGDAVPLAVLSGPTFAAEVAADLPAAVTLACADAELGGRLIAAIGSARFRPYLSHDIIGAQLGGAVKNVLAIACGIVEGRGLGDNARAALITRGLAEIAKLGEVLGADIRTLMGLSGLGDLTLTCNAMQSRNFSLGHALGKGRKLNDILAERQSVAEGVHNAFSVTELARRNQVDMPICQAVDAVINVEADLDSIIYGLLSRPLNTE
ncbi:NAD(P)H-dependent glycerol-3-phosphate dehydrogenase [Varunaivibrio sulfuroxidans]|uniref:Glycerol-3-phosphate dehydrogenase [NAD(P)+] n=1 Tax=Varunaivibrio sulfuroxidans TaxID=1773489 RepID=A0A4R3JH40_9PROT|nr:NAD(P)H-dependent glycerol-3-phosphate dehydrogenase [Varunaivibrio sulfuroxidans]TCS64815.1 glycerol-3-phosphate dehydrogenase (NAD(P)+) [Varunaivibrio sulfuroxidans]WES29884.1 NAD(P)-dependent glycerol-3-phosphate dehydrogenase [Varunaivibrio sulfuroxidans]